MKKIIRRFGVTGEPWRSLTQGMIRNLQPEYREPWRLRLAVSDSGTGQYIRAVYFYEHSKAIDTLEVFVALAGVTESDQRQGLGRSTFLAIQGEAGTLAREGGFQRVEMSARVDKRNLPCRELLTSMNWREVGPVPGDPKYTTWAIAGAVHRQPPQR